MLREDLVQRESSVSLQQLQRRTTRWVARMSLAAWVILVGCRGPGFASAPEEKRLRPDARLRSTVKVVDSLGRWSTSVTVAGKLSERFSEGEHPVEKYVLPGYVRVKISTEGTSKANCFVYEEPILAGQAMQRLLRAISPGLTFHAFSPVGISERNGQPLVELLVGYRLTQPPHGTGQMRLLVHPRVDFPVVCTMEWEGSQRPDASPMRDFVSHFEVASQEKKPEFAELWLIERGGVGTGFIHVQGELQGEVYVTVTRSTWFSFDELGAENRDRLTREVSRDASLVWVQWYEFYDGRSTYRGQLEREPSTEVTSGPSYRYAFEHDKKSQSGRFVTRDELRPSWALYRAFDRSVPGRGDLVMFDPYLAAKTPTACWAQSASLPEPSDHISRSVCCCAVDADQDRENAPPPTAGQGALVYDFDRLGLPNHLSYQASCGSYAPIQSPTASPATPGSSLPSARQDDLGDARLLWREGVPPRELGSVGQ